MMSTAHTAPLRNITAEIDHHHNNSLLRNSGATKPVLSAPAASAPATGPVYAPVYGPVTTPATNNMSVAAAPHAMLLQRNNSASSFAPAIARNANATATTASTTRLNPAAAEFGGLIGATSTKPARRVTLLRSSAPVPTAPTTATANKAQQDMMLQYQQMQQQQQQLAMMMLQQQQMLAASSAIAHPENCPCAGCFTSQQQRMLAQQQQLFFGSNDTQADTTRPQTPEANESNKENYAAVQATPTPATSAFVSPAKPRATLYRPVARNFFVTPVKESTASKGDQYLQNHTSSPYHQDPMNTNATPHSTPAGKGKRSNAIGKALQKDSFGISERNTPKASEKMSNAATATSNANTNAATKANAKAGKGSALTNASRKLLIGDEDDHAVVPIQRQNTSEPVKNITSFFAASPQGRKAAAAATVSTVTAPTIPSSTPLRAPAIVANAHTPNNAATRSSAPASSAKSSNGTNYYYVEVEGLLGQRTFALTKVADLAPVGTHVLFEGDRGEDMGKVVSVSSQPPTAAQMNAAKASGASPSQHHNGNSPNVLMMSPEAAAMPMVPNAILIRQASPEEISYWRNDLVAEAEDAVNKCTECIYRHNLNLIIVNAVFQFDRKKLTFYYETEQPRVDFRKMLAELYNEFHCRIWMERVE